MIKYSKEIARFFNKNFGVFTYSGSFALEIALKSIGVANKRVLIPYNACYRVLAAVLNSGGIPVIVVPTNMLYVGPEDVLECLKQVPEICAILLIYQYGIKLNAKNICDVVKKHGDIKIVEDVAQFWGEAGVYGDYVVTSLGHSKPLCNNFGGLIASNTKNFLDIIETGSKESRQKENLCLAYALDEKVKINEKNLMKKARKNVKKQTKNAQKIAKFLNKYFSDLEILQTEGVYHRLPVLTKEKETFCSLTAFLRANRIEYELPFKIAMQDLPILKGYKHEFIDLSQNKKQIVLIKTRHY